MVWLIILLVIVAAMAAVMWVAVGSPPTRPRPDSRYRGSTYMSVHRRLRRPGPPRDGSGRPPPHR